MQPRLGVRTTFRTWRKMPEAHGTLLVIEDDAPMRRSLEFLLRHEGYGVKQAATGTDGLRYFERTAPDVILLDLGLPDIAGTEIAVRIRARSQVPIIVISARDQEQHKIQALDAGANDYVTKPFSPAELLARIRVALRISRDAGPGRRVFRTGELCIDLDEHTVTLGGKRVELSSIEYQLLKALVQARGEIATHRQLLAEVWGPHSLDRVHYLRIYMKRLRYKLEACPAQPKYLMTEPGVGYRLAFDMGNEGDSAPGESAVRESTAMGRSWEKG
jgi:two-component system KDP operon response regulator KdpE